MHPCAVSLVAYRINIQHMMLQCWHFSSFIYITIYDKQALKEVKEVTGLLLYWVYNIKNEANCKSSQKKSKM